MDQNHKLVVFENKQIRRVLHNDEWHFSVVDVVEVLTDSSIPRRYWSDLKSKLNEEGFELYDKIVQLKLPASDGKYYETDCANTQTILRVVQSIPSPKAEPFKQWLAQVGFERVQEIENPELAQERMARLYQAKGYSDEWIEKRLRGIAVRQELTKEWNNRGVDANKEYAILTDEISKATFGKTVKEYKDFKSLQKKNQNLRDHMTDLELIFNMLGEASTTAIAKGKDARGFAQNKDAAQRGGKIAGGARENLEIETGENVVKPENYLEEPESKKRKRLNG